MNKILIVDDEEKLRSLLARIIGLEGFTVTETGNLKAALKAIESEEPAIILCDVKLPDGNGVDFVKEVKIKHPHIEIILLTAYGNIPDGIQAMKNGALDYLIKGDDNHKVIQLLNQAMEKIDLRKKVQRLEEQIEKKYAFDRIQGSSRSITEAIALAKKVAPTDATVLLTGETGTGKEVFAQAIHYASTRAGKPFLALNCSAFSKDLLESEIFGHKAGAFTGALKDKKGLIEEANNGTLFLDEIGEMHIDLQSKLLRVLETAEFIKVGDTRQTRINVRIIAATNRKIEDEIEQGNFREDLFYRLNVFAIKLPPLRDRKSDILPLALYFTSLYSLKSNKKIKGISKEAGDLLKQAYWKGNIRELKNIIERAVILEEGENITVSVLPPDILSALDTQDNVYDLGLIVKKHIQKILVYTKGNKNEAARLLNIGLATLYRKLEEYKIS